MDIDESVSFFQEFLAALYEQEVAALTESDEQLRRRVDRTESFMYAPPGTTMTSPFVRPEGQTPEELAEAAARAETPRLRPLFLVVEHEVPGLGTCFAGYVGGASRLGSYTYERQYWAMDVNGEPKIIAYYAIDFYADESLVDWENIEGAVIENIGDPVAARGLQEPLVDSDKQDYRRILEQTR